MKSVQGKVYRFGMEAGLVEKEEIIAWADQILLSDAPYCDAIADLAMCHNKSYSEIFTLLGPLCSATTDPRAFWQSLKPFLRSNLDAKNLTPRTLVSLLLPHNLIDQIPKEVSAKIVDFEIGYLCTYEGHGSFIEIDNEVTEYFNKVSD